MKKIVLLLGVVALIAIMIVVSFGALAGAAKTPTDTPTPTLTPTPTPTPTPPPPPTPTPTPGPYVAPCRITGGGTIDGSAVSIGLELHCGGPQLPNRLEVNWAGDHFHLTALTFVKCGEDPTTDPKPPRAGCDAMYGEGVGKYNGEDGYQAEWIFNDAGEPGTNDWAWIHIKAPNGSMILGSSGFLSKGNLQFHNSTGKDAR